jgi:hypothetical protein
MFDHYCGYFFVSKDLMKKTWKRRLVVVTSRMLMRGPNQIQQSGIESPRKQSLLHMTNYVARLHVRHTGGDLVPSPYLQVEIKDLDVS